MEQNLDERREKRRKRRKRNQAVAYLVLIVVLAALSVGIVVGFNYLTGPGRKKPTESKEVASSSVEESTVESTEEVVASSEVVETEVEVVPEKTTLQKLDEIANAGIEVMPLEDKVAGLFIISPELLTGVDRATKAGDGTKEALSKYPVGGLIYSSKNMLDPDQFKEMVNNTKLFSNYPLFLGTIEEGGGNSSFYVAEFIQRLNDPKQIAMTGDANVAHNTGSEIGTYMSEYGLNINLGPVADVVVGDNTVLGNRSFGSDSVVVSTYVAAMVEGLKEHQITPCLKQFPGIGSASQNPNAGIATTERTAEDFRANEFVVYQSQINEGISMIMVSNLSVPSLDESGVPCSLSNKVVTDILRNELAYDGVIVSDALNVPSITEYYTSEEAAIGALKAGCDMIYMPENFEAAYNGVLQAVKDGVISEERINDALRRIYRIKYADKVAEE